MKRYGNLYEDFFSFDNLWLAFMKARKGKTKKQYVRDFETNIIGNLLNLQTDLINQTYKPKSLKTFILRDPKTRRISVSDFRDRIVHHALCNIIEQIFDKTFIHDSYANRKGKGTHKAIERFDYFKKKVSKNNTNSCYILKCDIKKYFDSMNHAVLINILKKKIKDEKVIRLIKIILENHKSNNDKENKNNKNKENKGMPLGNLTSQFFANVYLNEFDQYVKHKLKIKYYIRYVDDFIIMHNSKSQLELYKTKINLFLKTNLKIELHKDKSKIILLSRGISFLGFRIFYFHKLLKNINIWKRKYDKQLIVYDDIYLKFEGWIAYARNANTFNLINKFMNYFYKLFNYQIASLEIDRWLNQLPILK